MAHRASDEDLRTFGSIVLNARVEAGLTNQECADKIGIGASSLCRIQAGNREPRLEIMWRICRVLPKVKDSIVKYLETGEF